jgi:hypothetical protein
MKLTVFLILLAATLSACGLSNQLPLEVIDDVQADAVSTCAPSTRECEILVWNSELANCQAEVAPDGTPCNNGACQEGICLEECWTDTCPSNFAISDGCHCRAVPTGSKQCLKDEDLASCSNIQYGQPWYGQDSHVAGGARAFVDNNDGTVLDTATSLIWAARATGALSLEAAAGYCSDPPDLPGAGWRMADIFELFTLVDAGNDDCMWDPVFGTGCAGDQMYWSGTQAYMSANFCTVHRRGNIEACEREAFYPVRCVRAPEPASASLPGRFLKFPEIVFDRLTGIAWESTFSGLDIDWKGALSACADKGSGWRVPTTTEIVSIIDVMVAEEGCVRWSDDLGKFCGNNLYFWTSTPNPIMTTPASVFIVHMASGHVHQTPTSASFNVRCVKTFQPDRQD